MKQHTTTTLRHEPTDDCDGKPIVFPAGLNTRITRLRTATCPECERPLCGCEYSYGHDCED